MIIIKIDDVIYIMIQNISCKRGKNVEIKICNNPFRNFSL